MKKPVPALIPFLVFISMVFIGILIYVYIETKKANPQMIETAQASLSTRRRGGCGENAEKDGSRSIRRQASGFRSSPRSLCVLRVSALQAVPKAQRA